MERQQVRTMSLSLLSFITTRLAGTSDTPALDASVLLAHIVGKPRTWVMAHPELTLIPAQQNRLNESLARLENGEPFPYVIGKWEFFGLEFEVTPDVLIPRPETELLVEKAIAWMQTSSNRKLVADVGTGSGAIAISLAVNLPHVNILATDISRKAIQVAQRNAKKHNVTNRIEFIECDLLPIQSSVVNTLRARCRQSSIENRKSKIDLLCANLPYIPTKNLRHLPIFGREPTVALDGGEDGLDLIRQLMRSAPNYLTDSSLLLLEIEATLGEQAVQLARQMFPQANVNLHKDLTGRDRLLEIKLP